MSAFQALGPFISTFANPNTTGLYFDEDDILQVKSVTDLTVSPAVPSIKAMDIIENAVPTKIDTASAQSSEPVKLRYEMGNSELTVLVVNVIFIV